MVVRSCLFENTSDDNNAKIKNVCETLSTVFGGPLGGLTGSRLPRAELGAPGATYLSIPMHNGEPVLSPNSSANQQMPDEELWSSRTLTMTRGPGFTM